MTEFIENRCKKCLYSLFLLQNRSTPEIRQQILLKQFFVSYNRLRENWQHPSLPLVDVVKKVPKFVDVNGSGMILIKHICAKRWLRPIYKSILITANLQDVNKPLAMRSKKIKTFRFKTRLLCMIKQNVQP